MIEIKEIIFVQHAYVTYLNIPPAYEKLVKSIPCSRQSYVSTSYKNKNQGSLLKATTKLLTPFIKRIQYVMHYKKHRIKEVWVQKYGPGDFHNVHIHDTASNEFSFLINVECNQFCSDTVFHNPGYPYCSLSEVVVKPVKGKCILFLGALPHEVLPNPPKAERIVVSGNMEFLR
tara:strand:- start:740 stop:1261 length:522 start_codon:yes stop_codon:yes gene_type:complete